MTESITLLRMTAADFEDRGNGEYWLGPIEPAKKLVLQDAFIFEGYERAGDGRIFYKVAFCYTDNKDDEREWGAGVTAEEAWRFALGAALGPYDYDEDEHTIVIGVPYDTPIIEEGPA